MAETNLDNVARNGRTILVSSFDIAFEVHIQELKDEVKFLIRMYDVEQPVTVASNREYAVAGKDGERE